MPLLQCMSVRIRMHAGAMVAFWFRRRRRKGRKIALRDIEKKTGGALRPARKFTTESEARRTAGRQLENQGGRQAGGAWFDGSVPRYGKDAGVGVRFAPLRSATMIGASRLDLVRRFATDRQPAGWVFVVGTGFTFDALR